MSEAQMNKPKIRVRKGVWTDHLLWFKHSFWYHEWWCQGAAKAGCCLKVGELETEGDHKTQTGPIPQYWSEYQAGTGDCGYVQPRAKIIREIHGDEAGLGSSQSVSPQLGPTSAGTMTKQGRTNILWRRTVGPGEGWNGVLAMGKGVSASGEASQGK